MAERRIASLITAAPERVGHPGALSLERCRLGPEWSPPDVVLFPDPARSHRRIVFVEAARTTGLGAAYRLIGRLLSHYTRALGLGDAGIEQLRAVARALRDEGTPSRKLSYRRVAGTRNRAEASALLATGRRLTATEVGLVALLDGAEVEAAERLANMAAVLRRNNGLDLRVALVEDGAARLLSE